MSQTQVIETLSPPDVFTGPSQIHGRGVYAARDFKQDETVEECPYLAVDITDGVFNFAFAHGDKNILPLGYGIIYNHADEPNLKFVINDEFGTMSYIAVRDINMGEELLIDYGKEWWEERKLPVVHSSTKQRRQKGFKEWRDIIFSAFLLCAFLFWVATTFFNQLFS